MSSICEKNKRESIYLYFCTDERHGPKTLPVLCLHTNNKQRGEVFISWPGRSPQSGEEPLLRSVYAPAWGPITLLTGEKRLHCPLTCSGLNSLGSTQNTTIWRKTSFLIRLSCESSQSIWVFFPLLYCVTERGIVNRQILCSNLCSIYKYCI